MDRDLKSLFETVDQLNPHERAQLMNYLTSGFRPHAPDRQPPREWQFDLAPGVIKTAPDFDDPLPDEFWMGEA